MYVSYPTGDHIEPLISKPFAYTQPHYELPPPCQILQKYIFKIVYIYLWYRFIYMRDNYTF